MSRSHAQILDQFWKAFSTHNTALAMELFSENSTYEDLGARHLAKGLKEIEAFWQGFFDNVPKEGYAPVRDRVFVAPDGHYATEWTMQFRLDGEFGGVQGNGKVVRFRGASVGCIEGDHIAWQRDYWDTAAVIEQIQAAS
ncbi:MAG: ester cyclase [Porticoccaceae bacterium]